MRKWYDDHGLKNPVIVAEKNDLVVGWASLSRYSTRCAYSNTSELSVYVLNCYQGQGIGTDLITEIMKLGKEVGLHVVISRIADGNEISVKLHEKQGFFHVGILKEVGKKFGKTIDVYLMQKIFD